MSTAGQVAEVRGWLRPIAHRGLHESRRGIVENTGAAFAGAIAAGYGIECDIRPAADGVPVVFHDPTTGRLCDVDRPVDALTAHELAALGHRDGGGAILRLGDLLDLVGGRVPVLVEIKSDWRPLPDAFLREAGGLLSSYRGPVAAMSFDPEPLIDLRHRAPDVPRGLVSANLAAHAATVAKIGIERARRLTHLMESRRVAPQLIAYDVRALPDPVVGYVREVVGLPVLAWTIRTAAELAVASDTADAPIFEGILR
ncbi:MAG: glycerophosphodiester phosphodiesterase family protein [Hyphomicrobiaceae bacterium]|nr:glycerophosphodiester phosphodiesterase family protein [Hyphomicrobiaceae bacterium]